MTVTPPGTIYLLSTAAVLTSTDAGRSFETLRLRRDLSNPDFNGVAVDDAGSIYLATNRGLWISSDRAQTFHEVTEAAGLGSDDVNGVSLGPTGHIYVATKDGFSISKDGGSHFANYRFEGAGSNSNVVYGVEADARGTIYARTWSGLTVTSGDHVRFSDATCCQGFGVRGVEVDPSGRLFVASDIGLFVSTDGGKSFAARSMSGSERESVRDVYLDRSGALFVGTPDGVWVTRDGAKTFSRKTSRDGLPSNDVQHIFGDDAGHIYVVHAILPYSDMED